ncbi:putative disease resistance protein RGA3 [Cornus florida]|uniref:putative disease resistance protein RGA3 n=1 Tax=Cornus florida TaxID=4283 RepID=UPI0028A00DC1|nr:putative disease resistance protein RGA3 [Cornus florida]
MRELYSRLSNKKYLIVLDNVVHEDEWYSDLYVPSTDSYTTDSTISSIRLSHGLPKEGGGAVIVTSRPEDVAINMVGEQNLLRLQPSFDEEEIWSIFMDSVRRKEFVTSDHHPTLSRMKDEIVDRCDGLPLAARTLAEIISIQLGKEGYVVSFSKLNLEILGLSLVF